MPIGDECGRADTDARGARLLGDDNREGREGMAHGCT